MDMQTNRTRWSGAELLGSNKRVGLLAAVNNVGLKFNLIAWGRRLHVCPLGGIPLGLRFRPLFFLRSC